MDIEEFIFLNYYFQKIRVKGEGEGKMEYEEKEGGRTF